MRVIRFEVRGDARPKGSHRAFFRRGMRYPVVTEDNARTRPWAALVRDAAQQAIDGAGVPFPAGPVALSIRCFLTRPRSLRRSVIGHTTKPDVDKLARAIADALKGVIWRDDAQIVVLWISKFYAEAATGPRTEITIGPVEPGEGAA